MERVAPHGDARVQWRSFGRLCGLQFSFEVAWVHSSSTLVSLSEHQIIENPWIVWLLLVFSLQVHMKLCGARAQATLCCERATVWPDGPTNLWSGFLPLGVARVRGESHAAPSGRR